MTVARPTAANERWPFIDALRGFALFGILFVNMTWFTGSAVLGAAQRAALGTQTMDDAAAWLTVCLVDGKFWSLFALLFGIGLAIQHRRALAAGRSFAPLALRRLTTLFAIGLAHAVFLWFGDIVSIYAVVGVFFIAFLAVSDRALTRWSGTFLLLPIVVYAVWFSADRALRDPSGAASDPGYGPAKLLAAFERGTYGEAFRANWAFLKERWLLAAYDGRPFKLLGMFLLGAYAVRRGVFTEPDAHRKLLKRTLIAGLAIGLPLNALLATVAHEVAFRPPSGAGFVVQTCRTLGIPALALAYAAGMALLWQRGGARRLLSRLTPVGRMSLTCYLMQTVIGIAMFYGYGLGYWASIGAAATWPVIVLIFVVQTGLCAVWLRAFQQGPIEWLWRMMTYARPIPLRRLGAAHPDRPADMSVPRP